jgi:hypothetical protein
MNEHLHHRRKLELIHENLLHGKLPRNLHWNDALELIGRLGEVQPHGGDEFAFIIGTKRELFKRPHTHELGIEEVSRLRKLLKEAQAEGPQGAAAQSQPEADHASGRMIVVIDHHAARIFQDHDASRPQPQGSVEPYDPYGLHHHLVHRKHPHFQGDRVPEDPGFYEEVGKRLVAAREIVLIGHGTGKSSAVDALVQYLQTHRPDIYQRVTGVETVDLSALTEPEIETIAKRRMSLASGSGRA